ncbi:pyridoxine kinase, putative [Plasmodium gallinaceum]|uniref:pyridoxal kinase n=1 Tax=Plasmodium gallinaceum TaxID=5849 RepID=A0A1J1GNA4_PLAGA|nr:pyridoxine kinase, putative [Plasmodium gallinaceum]CRG93741.1 pyridoxine kinase, putative [Plasmodium gallinaceum]
MNKENIISIQSQVFDGFCGNNVAIFVLRRRGHIPKILNTVQYYSKFKHIGVEIKSEELKTILNEFNESIQNVDNNIYFLTGYIRSKECVETVINNIIELKKKKKAICSNEKILKKDNYLIENLIDENFFWICDPVMGDNGKLYVDNGVVNTYKNFISFADIITPNQYELELLCNTKISDENDVINSIKSLLFKGVKIVIVTSINYIFDKDNLYLYIGFLNNKNKPVCFKYKFLRFDFNICGTGDLFSSLLLSFITRQKGNILLIISQVLNILQNVIKNSLNSLELLIIENQDIIASNGLNGTMIKEEEVFIP